MSAPIENTPDYKKIVKFFNKSVETIEKANTSKDFCKLLLTSLYEIFGYKVSSFWLYDEMNSSYFLASHRVENHLSQTFYKQNPLYAENLKDKYHLIGCKNVITIKDIMSFEEYESTPYYKNYLRTDDPYYYTALMLVKNTEAVIGAIALLRTKSEGDYTPVDLSNLDIITTFISNLVMNHLLVNNLISQKSMHESLSNQSPTGLIIFNASAPHKIGYINSSAYRYTQELSTNSSNQNPSEEFLETHIIDDYNFNKYTTSKTITSPTNKKFIINVAPSQTTDQFATTIYVYIVPQVETDTKRKSLLLKENKTLTQRQLEIIDLIIQGKTNEEIANELFISTNTVKTHLNNIYREMNVSNRFSLYSKLIES